MHQKVRKGLVVLGMHRSGTSAMCGVMAAMGCKLPADVTGISAMNPKGLFESSTLTNLNDDILASAGTAWFGLNAFPDSWYASPQAQVMHDRATVALTRDYGQSDLFVMQDPRHCRLVPFWEKAMAAQGIEPVYLCIHRHPAEVAASLLQRGGYEPLYSQYLWLRHVLDAEVATRGKTRVFVSFADLLADWKGLVARVSATLDLTLPSAVDEVAEDVGQFLGKDLNRAISDKMTVPDLEATSDWIATALQVLGRWSKFGEDPADHALMDRIRAEAYAASSTVVPVLQELQARHLDLVVIEQMDDKLSHPDTPGMGEYPRRLRLLPLLEDKISRIQTLGDQLARQTQRLVTTKRSPVKNLRTYLVVRALTLLATKHAPFSRRTKARFWRSANKRDPERHLFWPRNLKAPPEIGRPEPAVAPEYTVTPGAQAYRPDLPLVIIVSHDASRTGAPILALNLAWALSARNNVVTICLRGGALLADFAETSVETYLAQPIDGHSTVFDRIAHAISQRQTPAYAIVNSIESRIMLGALKDQHIPSVALFHEFASYTFPTTAFRDAFKLADRIVFSTELTLQNALQHSQAERTPLFHILPQGRCATPRRETATVMRDMEHARLISALRPLHAGANDFLVVGLGTVQVRKGVDLFLDVARRVLSTDAGRTTRFAWIGSGYDPEHDAAYSAYLRDQIERSGIADRVVILSETTEIEKVYALSDLLLLTSRLDPLPNVAIDALSEGIPVVCFAKTTGIADLLYGAGLQEACVADYLDTEQAAEKVLRLVRMPETYDEVCKTSQHFAAQAFDFATYADRIEGLGLDAGRALSSATEDTRTIAASGDFDPVFMQPPYRGPMNRDNAVTYYVSETWREPAPRRPEPGFNALVYARQLEREGIRDRDPYAEFLRRGRPAGPWLRQVIRETSSDSLPEGQPPLRTALHIHAYYPDVVSDIAARLDLNRTQPDLFINAGDARSLAAAVSTLRGYRGRIVEARVLANIGRDIGPFLTEFGAQLVRDYDLIGHVHTKKSVVLSDRDTVDRWVSFLNENMIGGAQGGPMLDRIVAAFAANPRLGIAFPGDPNLMAWSGNRDIAARLAQRLGVKKLPEYFDFPVGSMVWLRAPALQPFVDLRLGWHDYPPEPVRYDGTLLHALERMFGLAGDISGLELAVTNVRGLTR